MRLDHATFIGPIIVNYITTCRVIIFRHERVHWETFLASIIKLWVDKYERYWLFYVARKLQAAQYSFASKCFRQVFRANIALSQLLKNAYIFQAKLHLVTFKRENSQVSVFSKIKSTVYIQRTIFPKWLVNQSALYCGWWM